MVIVGWLVCAIGYGMLVPMMGKVTKFQLATNQGLVNERKPVTNPAAEPKVTVEQTFGATSSVKEGAETGGGSSTKGVTP